MGNIEDIEESKKVTESSALKKGGRKVESKKEVDREIVLVKKKNWG